MDLSLSAVATMARKEFYTYLKTKRLIIMGGLYMAGFLGATIIMCYYKTPDVFREVIVNAHSLSNIFYILLPIALSYDLIVREKSRKSFLLLLSKPITRTEVVVGKFVGIFSVICAVTVPIATIGHLIAAVTLGNPGVADLGRAYAFLGIILLGAACYVSLSLLFSTTSSTSGTALISSLIVGWFGLNMLYPVVNLAYALAGHSNGTPIAAKAVYLLSPSNNVNAAMEILSKEIMGFSTLGPVSPAQSIVALVIFLGATLTSVLWLFRKKDL